MSSATATAPAKEATHTQTRRIDKVAVLGAGIMGSRIAMHFANIGVKAVLLDIVPRELTEAEQKAGLTLEHPKVRNRLVNEMFTSALKSNPSPLYDKSFVSRVQLGNMDDHMELIKDADWVIEVVVERLDIKKIVFDKVEQHRKPGSIVSSNTSGIPIHMMLEGRSDDFKKNFLGTHFFNPPRYLRLLEIIPTPDTDPALVDFLMHYGDLYLGKQTVLCKDTPAFIANRVGIFGFMDLFHLVQKHGLRVEEVDKLTGTLIGHAKSATFRTADLVGLDTAIKVAKGIYDNCPDDEKRELFKLPAFVEKMDEQKLHGDKTGQGFYKKTKNAEGKKEILSLNLNTLEYEPQQKLKAASYEQAKLAEGVPNQIRTIAKADDKYGAFMRDMFYGNFAYCSHRIPEIADYLFQVDDAMAAGYGWQYGPFQTWDILGVAKTAEAMKEAGFAYAAWVDEMLAAGCENFYTVQDGERMYYDITAKAYKRIPGFEQFIILDDIRDTKVIWSNSGASIYDLGDGILNVEFTSKMNTLGGEVLAGINHAIDLAEAKYRGVVIGNQGENFTFGANLALILGMAVEQEYDELNFAVQAFQNTVMRLRYSHIPVVLAPFNMTLGGGCEMALHADRTQALAETYIGLVEVGVGLLPGGAGTKELAVRAADEYNPGDVEINVFQKYLMLAAQAKVATSAEEAFTLGILNRKKDGYSLNRDRLISDAKRYCLEMAEAGYTKPIEREDVRVLGRTGLGAVYAATEQLVYGGFASEHDKLIADKIGYVMCGGDLSEETLVSERYLLDLEREAFLQLCGERKTLERISHMLNTGKPLRN